ncbi:MAG: glucokinase [Acidimicrobiia bacterium]
MPRAIGVDVGGTNIRAGVVDSEGTVGTLERAPMPADRDEIARVLIDTIGAAIARSKSDSTDSSGEPPVAIGIGAAGLVDVKAGVVRFAPNIGYRNFAIVDLVQSKFGLPVTVDNDATAACFGEYVLGAKDGVRHMVLVTLGTGIGGGLVLDGKVYRGSTGFAGEIGHILVDPAGPVCGCGQRGCWEALASGTALGEMGRDAAREGRGARILSLAGGDITAVKGEHVVEAAREGDPTALAIMNVYAERVAVGLAVLTNVLDPDVFVIGGGVSGAADVFLERTIEVFGLRLQGRPYRDPIPVRTAKLGDMAGIIGAGLIALEESFT